MSFYELDVGVAAWNILKTSWLRATDVDLIRISYGLYVIYNNTIGLGRNLEAFHRRCEGEGFKDMLPKLRQDIVNIELQRRGIQPPWKQIASSEAS